tara:strand:- start:845 stop:1090 length:246 start_codon:yes stop_codon:yes gene_type:complete
MSKTKTKELLGVEEYNAKKIQPCHTCHKLITVGQPVLLAAYTTVSNLKTGLQKLDDQEDRCLVFHHHCDHCGEIFRVKNRV